MLRSAEWPLAEGIYGLLSGNVVVDTKTILVADQVPQDAAYPFLTLGEFEGNQDDAKGYGGEHLVAELEAVSAYVGTQEASRILDAALQLLDGQILDLTASGLHAIGSLEKIAGGLRKVVTPAGTPLRVCYARLAVNIVDE